MYADFEALVKSTGQDHATRGHKSFDYESQTPCSVGYTIVSTFPQFERLYKFKTEEDCVKWFVDQMRSLVKDAIAFYYDKKRLQWDARLAYEFNYETRCHICNKPFNTDHSDKVRDNDRVTGQYRAAAHKRCNIRLRRSCKIPIFFHNFGGYDSHFIAMALKDYRDADIKVIGQGMDEIPHYLPWHVPGFQGPSPITGFKPGHPRQEPREDGFGDLRSTAKEVPRV